MSDLRDQVIEIVRAKGLRHMPEPVQLASGEMSQDFIDANVFLRYLLQDVPEQAAV